MCATCGCSGTLAPEPPGATPHEHGADHDHSHPGEHRHEHGPGEAHDPHSHEHRHPDGAVHSHPHSHRHGEEHVHEHSHHVEVGQGTTARTIALEREILEKNRLLAERNRGWLTGREIFAVNLMSSPGSGKTTLLERTVRDLQGQMTLSVVEGDQETRIDAERIRSTGARVVQINTGTGCHLDAQMLGRALEELRPPMGSLLFVENVGNLVCPALFDLGESGRVVIASTTEGEDKPLKYPHMFRSAELILLNKVDLLPYLPFDVDRFGAHVRQVNPGARVLPISATRGDGLEGWYRWLRSGNEGRRRSCANP